MLQALETIGFVEPALRLSTVELIRQVKPLGNAYQEFPYACCLSDEHHRAFPYCQRAKCIYALAETIDLTMANL